VTIKPRTLLVSGVLLLIGLVGVVGHYTLNRTFQSTETWTRPVINKLPASLQRALLRTTEHGQTWWSILQRNDGFGSRYDATRGTLALKGSLLAWRIPEPYLTLWDAVPDIVSHHTAILQWALQDGRLDPDTQGLKRWLGIWFGTTNTDEVTWGTTHFINLAETLPVAVEHTLSTSYYPQHLALANQYHVLNLGTFQAPTFAAPKPAKPKGQTMWADPRIYALPKRIRTALQPWLYPIQQMWTWGYNDVRTAVPVSEHGVLTLQGSHLTWALPVPYLNEDLDQVPGLIHNHVATLSWTLTGTTLKPANPATQAYSVIDLNSLQPETPLPTANTGPETSYEERYGTQIFDVYYVISAASRQVAYLLETTYYPNDLEWAQAYHVANAPTSMIRFDRQAGGLIGMAESLSEHSQ